MEDIKTLEAQMETNAKAAMTNLVGRFSKNRLDLLLYLVQASTFSEPTRSFVLIGATELTKKLLAATELTKKLLAAPETPAPETPAPETPAPETPAPETPAPAIKITAADVGRKVVMSDDSEATIVEYDGDGYPVELVARIEFSDGETYWYRADGTTYGVPDRYPQHVVRFLEVPESLAPVAKPAALVLTAADVDRTVVMSDGTTDTIDKFSDTGDGYPVRLVRGGWYSPGGRPMGRRGGGRDNPIITGFAT